MFHVSKLYGHIRLNHISGTPPPYTASEQWMHLIGITDTIHCTLNTAYCPLLTAHCTLHTAQCTLHSYI